MSTGVRPGAARAAATDPDRPRHRGRWSLVALLSALFVVAPLGIEVYAQYARQTTSHTSVETRDHRPVKAVEVEAGSAELTVAPGGEGEVRIQERFSWSLRKPRVRKEWDGDTLKLRPECDGRFAVTSLGCSVQLDLTVPAGVDLRVRSGSGTVRVSGLTGPLDIDGGSGSVKLYGVSGPLKARVGSGSFSAAAIGSAEAEVRSGAGHAEVEFLKPPRRVTASAGSGSLELFVPTGSRYRIQGTKGSGARHIEESLRDPAAPRTLDVSAGSGTATVDYTRW
ncbi:hypothetical protein A8W25_09060 [Streptomyces sp. ERV7]|uniref:DUF4097 family beta strand repeat-containing protein n=1 Tax=Streptomyces sp. ERV7 TaxID=1322334 RepID=UPI0007F40293|nr:DUF4097 family beta strand repeat-containing protein [Streptomyces sp. ERV7]OAR25694.1 hypothetical protein A8W25_09060 [Streptomyces sp. ERV7]